MRCLALLLWLLAGLPAGAQTAMVAARDADLTVTLSHPDETIFESEMVLLTIHGTYRRHLTRERLIQPELGGFSWMQLGPDHWYDSVERGRPVRNFVRRMAVFPNRSGRLEIGAFTHRVSFLDKALKWFEHDIRSAPVTIEVTPAPEPAETWLPVSRLEISDEWSNAPDQLKPGEGVLRIVRVEAHGISPDMLPPMPTLTSPSAHIFPHPEKRLIDLSPNGPIAIAFWRWTIQPARPPSAIVEPVTLHYFDTVARKSRDVEISAQRIAYGELTGPAIRVQAGAAPPTDAGGRIPRAVIVALSAAGLAGGLAVLLGRQRPERVAVILRRWTLDADARALRRAARRADAAGFRRALAAAIRARGGDPAGAPSLAQLDAAIFGRTGRRADLRALLPQAMTDLRQCAK